MTDAYKCCPDCGQVYGGHEAACPACGSRRETTGGSAFLSGMLGHTATRLRLPIGATVANRRFTIQRELGQGRSGFVYLAEDSQRAMDVALKVMSVDADLSGAVKQGLNLALAINDYRHIVKLFDIHETNWRGQKILLLSMEYAEGGDFRSWLNAHRHDLERRSHQGLEYFIQVCKGIRAIHDAGGVHLDIKPENVIFSNGSPKVADFGTSHLFKAGRSGGSPRNASSGVSGTPEYMSPEQFLAPDSLSLAPNSDIYSLGVMLFELVSPVCSPPFLGTPATVRHAHLHEPVPTLGGIDARLTVILNRCLDKQPGNRFASAYQLVEAFQDFLGADQEEEVTIPTQDESYGKASRLVDQGHLAEALAEINAILAACPGHGLASNLKQKIEVRYLQAEQIYLEAANKLQEGILPEAVSLIEAACNLYPDHPAAVTVQTKAAMQANRFSTAMGSGLEALKRGDWPTALLQFREVQAVNRVAGNVKQIIECLDNIQEKRYSIDHSLASGDFETATRLASMVDFMVQELIASTPSVGW